MAKKTWIQHVMSCKKGDMSLGDAMKVAKKTWKKGGSSEDQGGQIRTGGQLLGKATGGRRTRKRRGGQLYSFSGGPYVGSQLSDGNSRNPAAGDVQWEGASPSVMTAGRRTRRRKQK